MIPAPYGMKVQDSATLAKKLTDIVAKALDNDPKFDVPSSQVKTAISDSISAVAQGFKESFTNLLIENSLLQPQNSFEGEPILLPDGVRFFNKSSKGAIVVVEQPPQVRSLYFTYDGGTDTDFYKINRTKGKNWYRLALPYTVFLLHWERQGLFQAMYCCYRNKPLASLSDDLCWSNLPNIWHGNRIPKICMPVQDFNITKKNFTEKIRSAVNTFWSSKFNNEISGGFVQAAEIDERVGSLLNWEKNSAENPLFVLDVDWPHCGTLTKLIKHTEIVKGLSENAEADVNVHANRLYSKLCDRALTAGRLASVNKNIKKGLTKQLESTVTTLVTELAKGLSVLENETVRKTALTALEAALKKALETSGLSQE